MVPAAKLFIQNVYQTFAEIPQHRHIDLKVNLLADLRMWKSFLLQYKGWHPIISNEEYSRMAIEIFADVSGNPSLGWGGFPSKGLWMYQQWDKGWFQQYSQSMCAVSQSGRMGATPF